MAPDLMALSYLHIPQGFKPPLRGPRQGNWDGSSPYHKNRGLRGVRGGDVLRLLRKPINFRNIPKVDRITVHSYVNQAASGPSAYIHAAGMAVQAISNVRVQTFKSKSRIAEWHIAPGRDTVACTAELGGENMEHFLGKLIDVVLPKMKDWPGVSVTSGDRAGNISFGLRPEDVAKFPEIEVNYDM